MTETAAKREPAAPGETRAIIVEAAARIFSERGYSATTVRDVAESVGIKAASLYYHFASKDEIFLAVSQLGVDTVFDAVRDAVESLPPDCSYRDRIGAAIRAHLQAALAAELCTSVNIRCMGQIPEDLKHRAAEFRRPYEQYWRSLLKAAVAAGEIRKVPDSTLLSLYIFGFMNWTLEWFASGRWSIDEIATKYAEILFDGVG